MYNPRNLPYYIFFWVIPLIPSVSPLSADVICTLPLCLLNQPDPFIIFFPYFLSLFLSLMLMNGNCEMEEEEDQFFDPT